MRVLYFEQWRGGHYYDYMDCLIPPLSELASEVFVAVTERASKEAHLETKFSEANGFRNVRFISVPDADSSLPIKERYSVLDHLSRCVADVKPDYVLVPSADAQTIAMGALGHIGVRMFPDGLPMEGTFHAGYGPAVRTLRHFMKEAVYRFAFSGSTWKRLNFINFLYYEYALRHRCRWANRARVMPHPIPQLPRLARPEARRLLGVPEDGRYIGLLGSLDTRKAVPELLSAFRAANLGDKDRLLLAGRIAPEYSALINNEYGDLLENQRLIVFDRFLADRELTQGYGALDLVCTTYRDFPGAASLMLRGIAAGRPVVSHDFGWSRALIKRFGVGNAVDISDIEGFARTLKSGLDDSALYTESHATKRLLEFHDPKNFTETMLNGLRVAMGKPELPVKTWDWVLDALPAERRAMR